MTHVHKHLAWTDGRIFDNARPETSFDVWAAVKLYSDCNRDEKRQSKNKGI
jgi:hypothetical protein